VDTRLGNGGEREARQVRSANQPVPLRGQTVNYAALPSPDPVRDAWIILEAVPQGHAVTEFAAQIQQHGGIGLLVPQHPH
jgi:hypothetical protein